MDFLSCYAIAVNEVNAAGGRIVTSPTNGAAGVIPAVLKYIIEVRRVFCMRSAKILTCEKFVSDDPEKSITTFLLTAAVSASACLDINVHSLNVSVRPLGCCSREGVLSLLPRAGVKLRSEVMSRIPP
jgi:hypothetical protein